MRTVLRIFARDLKRLAKNPAAIIVTIGVAIIPSLYAWFNILANWDPYENTSTMPIAVVIEDEGAEVGSRGFTNAGDMIREKLEENTQLGWTFVDSEDEAIEGVKAGTYYAAFVVPQDFTENLASVLDGDTDKAHIAYYVNEKANAIAPKVTDTGSTTIENQIANEFVDVVGETVTDKLQNVLTNATDKLDTTKTTVSSELKSAADDLTSLAGDINAARASLDEARSSISSARSSISSIGDQTNNIADSLSSTLDGLASTRTSATSLTSKLSSALLDGSNAVSGISSNANYSIGKITGEIGWAQGQLDGAINTLDALSTNSLADVRTSLERLQLTISNLSDEVPGKDEVVSLLDKAISQVQSAIDYTKGELQPLHDTSSSLKTSNDSVQTLADSANAAIQSTSGALSDLQSDLSSTTTPALSSALDAVASTGGQLVGGMKQIAPMLEQVNATLEQLDSIAQSTNDTLASTADAVQSSAYRLSTLSSDVAAVESAQNLKGIENVLDLNAESVGDFIGSPAELVSNPIYAVENYGSGVAPFYTNLALWVGGFVLVAIYKLEVDEEEIGPFKPWQGFFGRWLLLNLIGQIQAIICCVGDIMLGIQCVSPVAFVFAGMVESFVYVFFVYALALAFKHIGKALGVLLVVLQIPGASGTYPIEMQPDFFRALNPWLPFTYGINAMRETIAGFYGNYYIENLGVLLLYLIPALLIGVTARRHLLNINALFDRKLAETDMMITERTGLKGHFRLSSVIKAIHATDDPARNALIAEGASFELRYPKMIKGGFAALVVVPILLLVLMLVTEAKFAMLVLWICSLVGICTFLIVVEYLHNRIQEDAELVGKSQEELYELLEKGGEA